MPVWHERTRRWVAEGRLQLVGIIQEQHADRCRLLRQWQGFDWPILHDPINALGATAVPMFIAIDEHGIVRSTRARLDDFEASFLNQVFEADASNTPARLTPPQDPDLIPASNSRSKADSLFLWHRNHRLDDSIAEYRRALTSDPTDSRSQFRLGVCLLQRFENQAQNASDFQQAIVAWEKALASRPNQYIWRRRIQQYGPRLSKPYPFYDWVKTAEAEIKARGETPISLAVRPSGAEIATPTRSFYRAADQAASPDPAGQIHRDQRGLVLASVATVPSHPTAGSTIRLHITLTPNEALRAHWNNEVEPVRIWIDTPAGAQIEQSLVSGINPHQAESNEPRRFDVELKIPAEAKGKIQLRAYALYYVCEDLRGICQFLRQDIVADIPIQTP
ncbi:MAG: hypothetical protein P8L85_12665 [Rubripirellula sp.]|nr:hypothetical protein [Rubripirellula sp.]